jgi:HK97 family phage major capsid protein
MTIKAPITMTTGAIDNANGAVTPVSYVYQNVSGYSADVRPEEYIINFMDNGRTDKASLPYMDKLPNEGTMALTDEGELKPLISFSFELNYSQASKIAGRIKVSEEALDDINGLMSMIQNELRYEHSIAEQEVVFTKINAVAGAFVAGDMAGSTDAPSNYDAIRAAIYGIKIASSGRYRPNAVLVPSADVYAMGATKDQNDNYVLPPFVLPDGTRIESVQVVEVNDATVPAGTFVVGDFRKLKRRVYKEFSIRMGQGIVGSATAADIASDFEKNMYTIIGESRLHLWIYENEKVAFTKSTFAAVKTAIEAPAAV